jgi:hypothetical protein
MRDTRRYVLALGLVFSMTFAAPVALSGVAASEGDGNNGGNGGSGQNGGNGRDGRDGRDGADGSVEIVHDIGNVSEDNSCSVIFGNITTGDEIAPSVTIDASTENSVLSVIGSIPDTGVDIIAPGCLPQAEPTGG